MRAVMIILFIAVSACFLTPVSNASSPSAPLHIYLDADMTVAKASGISIERGIRTALAEEGFRLAGRPVEVVVLNHRGNSARSLVNLKKFLSDPDAFVLFTGLHSPPLLAHKEFINDNKILTLDPWAAAGPITRTAGDDNWIFRLSVDDTKAGAVITRRAVDERGFSKPALLLENTGWGKSNLKTMTASLKKRNITPVTVTRFEWGVSLPGAKIFLRNIRKAGADVIFLVANAPEGKTICKAMHELPASDRLPIVSHWGITGGDFPQVVTADIRKQLNLEFIQTRFSFMDMGGSSFRNKVFQEAAALFPEVKEPANITAPTGFIHAFDLTRLLVAAVKQCGLTGDMAKDRARVRDALENLKSPVPGLIKTYQHPFRKYSFKDKDAHEALGENDYTFGRYNENDAIILIR